MAERLATGTGPLAAASLPIGSRRGALSVAHQTSRGTSTSELDPVFGSFSSNYLFGQKL